MKNFVLSFSALFIISFGSLNAQLKLNPPQDLFYDIWVKQNRPLKPDQLKGVNTVVELIPGYPVNWINDYSSVEISTIVNGKKQSAVSSNTVLNTKQKDLLNNLSIGSEIIVDIIYYEKNDISKQKEQRKMHTVFTVSPEINASYIGGMKMLMTYVKENIMPQIPPNVVKKIKQSVISFIVDENGNVISPSITKTTGDKETDRLLKEALIKMPLWLPAKTKEGAPIPQVFELSLRGPNEGC